jgi:PAS domain S-box-containing protein
MLSSYSTAQKMLSLLIDSLQDHAIFLIDSQGSIVTWTPGVLRLLGYEEHEFLGQNAQFILTETDRESGLLQTELQLAAQHGRSEHEHWHQRRDGSLMWGGEQVLALRDENGQIEGFAKILRDQTQQKNSAEALRETQQRLQISLDSGRIGTWEWDIQNNRLVADHNVARLFGLSLEESVGCPVENYLRVIHPDDTQQLFAVSQQAIQNQSPFSCDCRILQRDGQTFWIEASGHIQVDSLGNAAFINGVVFDISSRKRAEAAFGESEERYRTLFEAIDSGFCVIEVIFDANEHPRDYRFLEVNRAFESQTGLQDAVGKTAREMVPNLDEFWFQTYGKIALTGEPIHFEANADAMGRVFDVHAFRFGITNERRVAVLFTDVTQQRQQQRTLQLLVDLNRATQPLTEADEVMAVTARFLGEFLGVNRCAYAEVEADEDHFVITGDYTRDTFSIVGSFQMASFGEDVLRLMREGQPYIVENARTDPRITHNLAAYEQIEMLAVVCVPLQKDGRFVAAMAVHQKVPRQWTPDEVELIRLVVNGCWEVIERARAIRNLRASQARLSFMAESMPQKIFTSSASGEIDYFNQQWMEFTGLSFEQIKGWGWRQFMHPDDLKRTDEAWSTALQTGQLFQIEHRFRRADGEYRWHLSRAHAMRDEHDKIVMWLGSNTDIDDVKQGEAEKIRLLTEAQEANRVKDEFLATLSHELRSPLTAIMGWTSILQSGKTGPHEIQRGLSTIERNARAQSQLIEDILDVSRVITGKLRLEIQPVDLRHIIEDAVASVLPAAQAKDIRLQYILDVGPILISGDPARLQQVVWNLLSNAIKFTPRAGRVQIQLEVVDAHVEISVTDNGVGIASDVLPHVFDRFRQADSSSTRAHGGLGLGLAIVRHLVELHGGVVEARSEGLGKGSVFTVKLPPVALHSAHDDDSETRSVAQPGNMRRETADAPQLDGLFVLVVDDQEDTRVFITLVLERCGARVMSVGSAAEALSALQELRPDVLLSDIGMPGEDGYSLIKRVRALPAEQGGQTPAAALTAFARVEDRVKALRAGFQIHLPKPVEPMELASVIATLAGRHDDHVAQDN